MNSMATDSVQTPGLEALLVKLRQIVGESHVLTPAQTDLSAFEQDWRQRSRGHALAVVRPISTQQVAEVVKACFEARACGEVVSIVPQGGNTGLVVGGVPDATGTQIVLSLQRMNAVRELDAANLTLTVESGCILQNLQTTAAQAGFLFPLSLAAQGSCTIGGNLATNAGGTQVLRYGNARELCLGLEVVTAQGEVWQGLAGLRKDNTGYDLRDLFIGSEGTLGIITAACMKLYPQPAAKLTAWAIVPSLTHAVQLLGLAQQQLSAGLTGFEVMGQFALELVAKHFPQQRIPFANVAAPSTLSPLTAKASGDGDAPVYAVLLENVDSQSEAHARERFENLLDCALTQGLVMDAVVAENLAQSQALWHVRESIPMAQAAEGLNIKHDISLPISRIADFVRDTDAQLQQCVPHVRIVNFGHLGDGNLHYNVQAPVGSDAAVFLQEHEAEMNHLVFDSVRRYGGAISAEHGVGSLKVDTLPRYKSPVALQMMRQIKRALDTQCLLNPGRVVRVDASAGGQ